MPDLARHPGGLVVVVVVVDIVVLVTVVVVVAVVVMVAAWVVVLTAVVVLAVVVVGLEGGSLAAALDPGLGDGCSGAVGGSVVETPRCGRDSAGQSTLGAGRRSSASSELPLIAVTAATSTQAMTFPTVR